MKSKKLEAKSMNAKQIMQELSKIKDPASRIKSIKQINDQYAEGQLIKKLIPSLPVHEWRMQPFPYEDGIANCRVENVFLHLNMDGTPYWEVTDSATAEHKRFFTDEEEEMIKWMEECINKFEETTTH